MTARLVTAIGALAIAFGACKDEESKEKPSESAKVRPVDMANPDACADCHGAIVREYQQSMHARAHHSRDPIYAGVRQVRMKKEGDEIAGACARCHTPGFEEDPGAEAARIGVGCNACHGTRVGAEPGFALGPHDIPKDATGAHGTGPRGAIFADGVSLCMTCHGSLDSPTGVAMCTTGPEHQSIDVGDRQSCVSCHMPATTGVPTEGSSRTFHASHAFLGPHRAWYQDDASFVASGFEFEAALDGDGLAVTLRNQSGHALPTGFPGRMVIVSCSGRDEDGEEIWQCEPAKLTKVYTDADGEPTLAPYAEKLARDTRLTPGATETYRFPAPAEVTDADVTVSMRLVPPPLAEKLGLADAPEGEPRAIARVTAKRAAGD